MRKSICLIVVFFIISVSGTIVKAYTNESPIRIDSNSDFIAYASSGNGTAGNPWIISGLDINGSGAGFCIYVGNTTDYFVIQNCLLHHASTIYPDDYYRPNSGIVFNNVENGRIYNNTIQYNEWFGIYTFGACDNSIECNQVNNNDYGIYVCEYSNQNIIEYNNASNNVYSGIAVDQSEFNHVYRNTADHNEAGYHVFYAWDNTIEDNLAFYNDYGILIQCSEYNTVLDNSFCLSSEYGAYVCAYSTENEIYHNNFGNNTAQAYDASSTNIWCAGYPDGGNFWTDYNGTDNYSGYYQNQPGSDGLGDTPYYGICGGSSQDDYPLMEYIETYGLGIRDDPSGLGIRDDPS